jgi:membrane associated rhomboid family serine protease
VPQAEGIFAATHELRTNSAIEVSARNAHLRSPGLAPQALRLSTFVLTQEIRMPPMPPITQALLLLNVAAFCIDYFLGPWFTQLLALWPLGHGFLPWQIVTYAFLHGSVGHLFFNMLGLWMFGSELERLWGTKRFMQFYAASVLAAAATQLVTTSLTGSVYPTVGASGGLFGLLLAFGMTFPDRIIMPLFPPIPMKAKIFVALYGGLELFLGFTGSGSGVAHFAHLGGMLGGFLVLRYWGGKPPFGGSSGGRLR